MALSKIQKIRLITISKHREEILEALQNTGCTEIISLVNEESSKDKDSQQILKKLQKLELEQANIEFAIKALKPYEVKKSFFEQPMTLSIEEVLAITKNFDHKKVISEVIRIEDKNVKEKNNIALIESKLKEYQPWKSLNIDLEDINGTKENKVRLGSIKTLQFEEYLEKFNAISKLTHIEVVTKTENETFFYIIFDKTLEESISKLLNEYKFSEADIPLNKGKLISVFQDLKKELKESTRSIVQESKEFHKLAKNLDNLKVTYDYLEWEIEKSSVAKTINKTHFSSTITAWAIKKSVKKIQEELEKISKEILIEEIEPEEGEIPPVTLVNSNFMSPFEAVTKTYGLPLYSELDPTPYLSVFFIIFFALCLTDAGYGIIMFITMWAVQRFMKLPIGTKNLVRLLMYGGIATFFVGAIFGGWFGMTADQVPEFLTTTNAEGEKMFILQKINALTDPLTVLILALGLGYVQITLGIFMKLFHNYKNFDKKEAILDSAPWGVLMTGIGFFVLTQASVLPIEMAVVGKWWIIISVIIVVLTQGRDKKNPIFKLLSGILSLYGLVGYMSDILSYSRLLALGLATAIIGLAVNVIALLMKDMIPYFGWVLMIVILIGGHIFNLLINALGSFIHSGRLQFVEFFGKFMEGGGEEFKPFNKKSKYIYIK